MNRKHNIIITSLATLALSIPVLAHGGFEHVMGTVVKADAKMLTVKTTKGDVAVMLNEKTEITKADKKAMVEDLTPGVRVVVDIPEGSKEKIAHSVKVGVAAAPAASEHEHK